MATTRTTALPGHLGLVAVAAGEQEVERCAPEEAVAGQVDALPPAAASAASRSERDLDHGDQGRGRRCREATGTGFHAEAKGTRRSAGAAWTKLSATSPPRWSAVKATPAPARKGVEGSTSRAVVGRPWVMRVLTSRPEMTEPESRPHATNPAGRRDVPPQLSVHRSVASAGPRLAQRAPSAVTRTAACRRSRTTRRGREEQRLGERLGPPRLPRPHHGHRHHVGGDPGETSTRSIKWWAGPVVVRQVRSRRPLVATAPGEESRSRSKAAADRDR